MARTAPTENPPKPLLAQGQKAYFESSESMERVANGAVDLVFTSPPYWLIKNYSHEKQIGREAYQTYLDRLNKVWNECYRVTTPNAVLAINIGSKRHLGRYHPIAMDIYKNMADWKLLDQYVWFIPNALPQPNHYMNKLPDNKYESILVFAKNHDYDYTFNKIRVPQKYRDREPRKHKINPAGRSLGNVFKIPAYRPPNIRKQCYHEAAFPENLAHLIIHTFTNRGQTVLDPFLGSGTVLKVCRHTGRRGIGFEINENNRDLIKQRILESWIPSGFDCMDIIT